MDLEELTGSADRNETGRPAHPAVPLVEQAMMGYGTPGPLDSGEPGRQPSTRLATPAQRTGANVPGNLGAGT